MLELGMGVKRIAGILVYGDVLEGFSHEDLDWIAHFLDGTTSDFGDPFPRGQLVLRRMTVGGRLMGYVEISVPVPT